MAGSARQGYRSYLAPGETGTRTDLRTYPPMLRISDLAPEKQRRLRTWIRDNDPAMAERMRNTHTELCRLRDVFGAGVSHLLPVAYVREALK